MTSGVVLENTNRYGKKRQWSANVDTSVLHFTAFDVGSYKISGGDDILSYIVLDREVEIQRGRTIDMGGGLNIVILHVLMHTMDCASKILEARMTFIRV
jgi:hypothetical protein